MNTLTVWALPAPDGADAAAITGSLEDFGVADDFIKRIRDNVVPGTSALFVLSTRATAGSIGGRLAGPGVVTLRSELSPEQAELLLEALADG